MGLPERDFATGTFPLIVSPGGLRKQVKNPRLQADIFYHSPQLAHGTKRWVLVTISCIQLMIDNPTPAGSPRNAESPSL